VGAGEPQVLTEVVDEQRARLTSSSAGEPLTVIRTVTVERGSGSSETLILPGRRVVRLLRTRPDPSAAVRAPRWYRAAHGPHVVCFR
jgi:hypothetical protein